MSRRKVAISEVFGVKKKSVLVKGVPRDCHLIIIRVADLDAAGDWNLKSYG